ncbi:MAG: hypothetical protein WC284_16265 [Candidimonas sp.]
MILIAHRGNTDGPNPDKENNPLYIIDSLKNGYHCEIDVWLKDGQIYLGHDCPQYQIGFDFLTKDKLWCHAKNIDALQMLIKGKIHCFWHQTDDVTLTSNGWLWTYPGKDLTRDSIAVMPEWVENYDISAAYGVCSDFVSKYKKGNS